MPKMFFHHTNKEKVSFIDCTRVLLKINIFYCKLCLHESSLAYEPKGNFKPI